MSLAINGKVTQSDAFDVEEGKVTVTARNGIEPYLYSLNGSNWQTNGRFKNLKNGQYSIVIKDGNGTLHPYPQFSIHNPDGSMIGPAIKQLPVLQYGINENIVIPKEYDGMEYKDIFKYTYPTVSVVKKHTSKGLSSWVYINAYFYGFNFILKNGTFNKDDKLWIRRFRTR